MRFILAFLLVAGLSSGALAQQDSATPITSFDPGPMVAIGTPANSSHAAGVSVGCAQATCPGAQGALFAVPIARFAGYSTIVVQYLVTSSGGYVGSYVLRLWSKLPINTTCQDNANFVGNFTTDDAYLLQAPLTITPAVPGSTQGDGGSYAGGQVLLDFHNGDSPGTKNAYACLTVATGSTDTADQNKPIRVMLTGPQN